MEHLEMKNKISEILKFYVMELIMDWTLQKKIISDINDRNIQRDYPKLLEKKKTKKIISTDSLRYFETVLGNLGYV